MRALFAGHPAFADPAVSTIAMYPTLMLPPAARAEMARRVTTILTDRADATGRTPCIT